MNTPSEWNAVQFHVPGGLIVANMMAAAVILGSGRGGDYLLAAFLALVAGVIGGLLIALSLRLYHRELPAHFVPQTTAMWAAVLVAIALSLSYSSRQDINSPAFVLAALVLAGVPVTGLTLGLWFTLRWAGLLSRRLKRRVLGAGALFALVNLVSLGAFAFVFTDFLASTALGMVVGAVLGLGVPSLQPESVPESAQEHDTVEHP